MNKAEAQQGIKKLNAEIMSLNPGAMVTFFEIDVSDIAFDAGITDLNENQRIFRFHNTISLFNTNLYWQGRSYVAAPITAQGFDLNAKGTAATPSLGLTVSEAGISALSRMKDLVNRLGDIVGAKVTRKRTLAKYLDDVNFFPAPIGNAQDGPPPIGFGQDWTVQFPDDVFFIARKSNENKYTLEYELGTIFDVNNIQLPNRLVSVQRCMWSYRGFGCFYEYKSKYNTLAQDGAGANALKDIAPPVASALDVLITTSLGITSSDFKDRGKFNILSTYQKGDFTYLVKNGLNYYYVAKVNGVQGVIPPNNQYWIEDQCSKTIAGCRLRFLVNGNTFLPFGGFPTVGKYS